MNLLRYCTVLLIAGLATARAGVLSDINVAVSHHWFFYQVGECDDCFRPGNQFSITPSYPLYDSRLRLELEFGYDLNSYENSSVYRNYIARNGDLKSHYDFTEEFRHAGFTVTPGLRWYIHDFFAYWGTTLRWDIWSYRAEGVRTDSVFNTLVGYIPYDTVTLDIDTRDMKVYESLILGAGWCWQAFEAAVVVRGLNFSDIGTYVSWRFR